MDDLSGDESEWDDTSFQEWLDSVAASEGISRQEVLDRMMSSYWVLDEVRQLIEESDKDGIARDMETLRADTPDSSGGRTSDPRDSPPADQENLEDLLELLELLGGHGPNTVSPDTEDTSRESLIRLDSELTRTHDKIERLADRIDTLIQHQQSDSSQRDLAALSELLGDNAATPDPTQERVAELSDDISELDEQLGTFRSRQRTLKAGVEQNFDQIKDVLEYLIQQADSLDTRVEEVSERLEIVRRYLHAQQKVAELKRTANTHGITDATCEGCDSTVNIALLERPECPNCNRLFEDVSPKTGWFGSHTLSVDTSTARSSADMSNSDIQIPSRDDETESEQASDKFDLSELNADPINSAAHETESEENPSDEDFDWIGDSE